MFIYKPNNENKKLDGNAIGNICVLITKHLLMHVILY